MRYLSGVRGLVLVFVAAFCARAAYVATAPTRPLAGDELGYHAYAQSLLDSHSFANGELRASRTPGYPAFAAAVYAVFGRSARTVQWVQCLAGALACVFIAVASGGLLDDPWPAAAGLTAAFYYDLIYPTTSVASECVYGLAAAAAFAALLSRHGTPRRRAACLGLSLLAAHLVRPDILPAAAIIVALMPVLPERGYGLRDAAAAGLIVAAGVGAWALRNALLFHRFLPATTTAGVNMYQALRLPLTPPGVAWTSYYQPPAGGELAIDAGYRAAFFVLLRSSAPAQIAKAYAVDLLSQLYPFLPRYDWTYVLLVPFWLTGLWLSRKRSDLVALTCFVLLSIATYTAFGGPVSRYRCEYAPALIVLAAAGASWLWKRFPGRAARASAAWLAANLIVFLGAGHVRALVLALKSRLF